MKIAITIIKRYAPLAIAIVALFSVIYLLQMRTAQRDEINRLNVALAHAQIKAPVERVVIRDSVPVYTSQVTMVDRSSFKKELADKQLIKDIGIKTGQIESQQRTETVIRDTVYLSPRSDSIFTYDDQWTSFRLSMRDTSLTYAVRDSITTIVYREYKHRFLFWRWGTKGYKVKVINFNPHATLQYNQYIKVN